MSKKSSFKITRNQWLIDFRIPFLTDALRDRENLNITRQQAFDVFSSADPSTNNSAVQWLIESYCREGFRWEDIENGLTSKVSETLQWFARYKNRLPEQNRNLYRYKTVAEIYSAVEPFVQAELSAKQKGEQLTVFGREQKRMIKQQVLKETYILLDKPNLKIVVPLTREASEWWGKGTRWCTAAREHNQFSFYNRLAPLIILLFEDQQMKSRRLQIWLGDTRVQFMDEADERVSKEFVDENWDILKSFVLFVVDKNPRILQILTDRSITHELCLKIVQNHSNAIEQVPEKFKTKELCSTAFDKNYLALPFIPEEFRTIDMYQKAIKQDGEYLRYMPEELFTAEIVKIAIESWPDILEVIPKKFKTKELCWFAVSKKGYCLKWVPQQFKTYDLCAQAVKDDGYAIESVPTDIVDEQMCSASIEQDGYCLRFIPPKFITQQLCERALEQNINAFSWIPDGLITDKMMKLACAHEGYNLASIKPESRTFELCQLAIQNNPEVLNFVPDQFRTLEICEHAFTNANLPYEEVPLKFHTQDFFKRVVEKKGIRLRDVPKRFKTVELCRIAVEQNPKAEFYIPPSYRENELKEVIDKVVQNYQNKSDQDQSVKWTIEEYFDSFEQQQNSDDKNNQVKQEILSVFENK